MIKNVALKKVLKSTVFKILTVINKVLPKSDNMILLYQSNRGISFNLAPLQTYLLNNNYNKKYRIICGIEDMKYAGQQAENMMYVNHFKAMIHFFRSAHVFYTAGQIPIKPSKKQIVIHMRHGAANFKKTAAMTNINNGDEMFFTYMVAPSPIYVPIEMKEYHCKKENIVVVGEPMTDIFFGNYTRYDLGDFSKILMWTPTFRQSDYLGYDDSTQEELLPTFTEDDYTELNQKLVEHNFKLIVKLHPAQNVKRYKQLHFSNLDIYSHVDFESREYELYNMMPQVDVMIGDYSSTFLQFLLLDRPVAFVVPDIEEFSERRGFVFDNYEDFMPGEIIKSKAKFYDFLDQIASGQDDYYDERLRVKNIIHTYQDGDNCKRILNISGIKNN